MNLREIETLVDLVHVAKVSEVTISSEGRRVTIRKDRSATPASKSPVEVVGTKPVPSPPPAAAPPLKAPTGELITSPMVGVYHAAEPALKVGVAVKAGQIIGSIESMRLMNDLVAEVSGVVGAVMLEDGMAVEYGQSILRVDHPESAGEAENGA
jgi:acetyl-CoA carboxylase biotin carboxyl carrier protein